MDASSQPGKEQWHVLTDELVFDASPHLRVRRQRVRLPDGREVPDFYQVDMRAFALVFAETESGEVIGLRQYKHAARRVILGLPGGYLEDGEEPCAAAERELLEETGYGGGAFRSLGAFVCNGNQGCGTMHVIVARGVHKIAEPDHDDLEQLEPVLVPRDELQRAIADGRVPVLHQAAAIALALCADMG